MTKNIKLVYKPTPGKEKQSKDFLLHMSKDLDRVVRGICAHNNLSINGFICDMLKERIEELAGDTLEGIARSLDTEIGKPLQPETSSDAAARTLARLPLAGAGKPDKVWLNDQQRQVAQQRAK